MNASTSQAIISSHPLSLWRKVAYSIVLVATTLLLLELALRILSPDYYETNQYFQLNRDISFTDVYDKDHVLFWRLKRSIKTNSELFSSIQYRTNSQGFRGSNFPVKGAKTRIVALGNSCTFGWGVAEDRIYTAELQRLAPDVETLNCGTPGYSSFQGKKLLAEIAPRLQPDILLIMYGWNDHWPAGHGITDKEQRFPPQLALDIQNTLSSLSIYKALRRLSLRLVAGETRQTPMDQLSGRRRVPLLDFKNNLSAIISYCRERGITPILLSPPIASLTNYFPGKSVSAFHDLHRAYQSAIAEVGAQESVTTIDLQSPFDTRNDLFDNAGNDAIHFNAAGHLAVARQIKPIIDSILSN